MIIKRLIKIFLKKKINPNKNENIKVSIIKNLDKNNVERKNLATNIIEGKNSIIKKKNISKEGLEILESMRSKNNLNINKLMQDTKHTYTKKEQ